MAGSLLQLRAGDLPVTVPVSELPPSPDFAIVVCGETGTVVTATAWFTDGSQAQQATVALHNGQATRLVFRRDWNGTTTVRLQRSDTRADLSASALVRL